MSRFPHLILAALILSVAGLAALFGPDVEAQRRKSDEPLMLHGVAGVDSPKAYGMAVASDPKDRKGYAFGGFTVRMTGETPENVFSEVFREFDFKSRKGEWTPVVVRGDKPNPRAFASAEIYNRGRKLYMFGGVARSGDRVGISNEMWEFDLGRKTWKELKPAERNPRSSKSAEREPVAQWPLGRDMHGAVVDETAQKMYVHGGRTGATEDTVTVSDELWAFDLKNASWQVIEAEGDGPGKRLGHSMTMLGDGKILLAGGTTDGKTPVVDCHLFDPKKQTWSKASALPAARSGHSAIWNDKAKRVILVNGHSAAAEHGEIFAYDPKEDKWLEAGHTLAPSFYGGLVLEASKDVMQVLPGRRADQKQPMHSKVMNLVPGLPPEGAVAQSSGTPAAPAPAAAGGMRDRASLPAAIQDGDGPGNYSAGTAFFDEADRRIVMFGGQTLYHDGDQVSLVEYNYEFRQFKVDAEGSDRRWEWLDIDGEEKPIGRAYPTCALAPKSRKYFVFGGVSRTDPSKAPAFLKDFWVFDLASRKWQQISPKDGAAWPGIRTSGAMVVSDDEKTLWLFSGMQTIAPTVTSHHDLWKFDIEKGTWSEVKPADGASLPEARFWPGMVSIGGNRAILFGGNQGSGAGAQTDTWEFNLSTGGFTRKASIPQDLVRLSFAAAWDAKSGRVLLANGVAQQTMDDVIAYDPKSDSWTHVGVTGYKSAYGCGAVDPKNGHFYLMCGTEGGFYGKLVDNRMMRWSPEVKSAGKDAPEGGK